MADVRAVGIHHEQLTLSIARRSEGDHRTVGRPGGVNVVAVGERTRVIAVGFHYPESVTVVGEEDQLSAGGKLGGVETAEVAREALRFIPIDVDRVDFKSAVAFGGEVNRLASEGRVERGRVEVGELDAPCAVGVHQADLVNLFDVTDEDDFSLRRRRVAEVWDGRGDGGGRKKRCC